jgi:hypothetical protein
MKTWNCLLGPLRGNRWLGPLRGSSVALVGVLSMVACDDSSGGSSSGAGGSSGAGQTETGVCYYEYRVSYSCSDGDGDPGSWEATCSDISEDACYNSPDFDGSVDYVDGCNFVTEFSGNEFLSQSACEDRLPDASTTATGTGGGSATATTGSGSGCTDPAYPVDCYDGTCCQSAYPICCGDGLCYTDQASCDGGSGGGGICGSGLTTDDATADACLADACCSQLLACTSNGADSDSCIACMDAGGGALCDAAIACINSSGC